MRKKDQRQFVTKADIHIANLRIGQRLLRAWRNPNWLPWGNPYLHTCPTIWMLRSILGSIASRKCSPHATYKFPSLLPHKLDFCISPHCKIEKLVMNLRKKDCRLCTMVKRHGSSVWVCPEQQESRHRTLHVVVTDVFISGTRSNFQVNIKKKSVSK